MAIVQTDGKAPAPQTDAAPDKAMRVLAAEDNPVFQSMLRTLLRKWGYDAVLAQDGNEALRILESDDAPRLAVLDWMMPGLDGVEICRRVRSANREPYLYILLLTARNESDDLIAGMDAGADDYLTKPFNAHELRVRIRAGRRILDLQDALRQQATHAGLTGLLNRNSVLEKLDEEIAILMADLDRFKSINDTRGDMVGDRSSRGCAAIQNNRATLRFRRPSWRRRVSHCAFGMQPGLWMAPGRAPPRGHCGNTLPLGRRPPRGDLQLRARIDRAHRPSAADTRSG